MRILPTAIGGCDGTHISIAVLSKESEPKFAVFHEFVGAGNSKLLFGPLDAHCLFHDIGLKFKLGHGRVQPCSRPCDHAGTVASAGVLTAWQATPSISAGACLRHRSNTSGQRGLKAQPGGGSIGLGISPFTGIRWRPDIARSGTAPSSVL